jgi:hypothetical protein
VAEDETLAEREPAVTTSGLIIPPGNIVLGALKDIPLKVGEYGRAEIDVEAARAAGWKLDHTGWHRG